MSPEYQKALQISNEAQRVYNVAVQAYRNRETNDETYLTARKVYTESQKAFDLAFSLEENRK